MSTRRKSRDVVPAAATASEVIKRIEEGLADMKAGRTFSDAVVTAWAAARYGSAKQVIEPRRKARGRR
jgi:predicted transcriptional regulator